MALSQNGLPLIAYVGHPPHYPILYRQLETTPEIVGIAGNREQAEITLDLALTPTGQPGLVYTDDRSADLIYAIRDASGWITETVDAAGNVGYFPSLAYDPQGQPHISYHDNTYNDVKYATRTAEGWQLETIDATGLPGFHISTGFTQIVMHCDPSPEDCAVARPEVAYLGYRYKPYDGELRYAIRYAWGWQIETVDTATGAGGFPSLALAPDGYPWISYYRAGTWDYNTGELRVAHYDGERWQVDVVDRRDNAGRFNSLALIPTGMPVIAYYTSATADLRLAWLDGRWHTTTLLSEGDVGGWTTLAADTNGVLHLTFADGNAGLTQYAILHIQP